MSYDAFPIREYVNHLILQEKITAKAVGMTMDDITPEMLLEILNAMMNSNGESFDYYFELPGLDYLISGILVLVVSMLVGFLFSKRIKRLDMVGTLKGAD